MRRIVILAALAATVLTAQIATAGRTHACSCVSWVDDLARVAGDAEVAFIGRPVTSVDIGYIERGDGQYVAPVRWTFAVDRVLRGNLPDHVVVGLGYGDGDCGRDLRGVGSIGVLLHHDALGYATSTCGGLWSAVELGAVLGAGWAPYEIAEAADPPPTPADDAPWGIVVALSVVALTAGVGTWMAVRRAGMH